MAAGMLAPVGEAIWGEEALMRLGLASARAWPGFAAELAADSELEVGYAPAAPFTWRSTVTRPRPCDGAAR